MGDYGENGKASVVSLKQKVKRKFAIDIQNHKWSSCGVGQSPVVSDYMGTLMKQVVLIWNAWPENMEETDPTAKGIQWIHKIYRNIET